MSKKWAILIVSVIAVLEFVIIAAIFTHDGDKLAQDPYRAAYERGMHHGALQVINYSRQSAGDPPFKSWEDYEDFVAHLADKTKEMDEFFKEIDALQAKRELARKARPQPWVRPTPADPLNPFK